MPRRGVGENELASAAGSDGENAHNHNRVGAAGDAGIPSLSAQTGVGLVEHLDLRG